MTFVKKLVINVISLLLHHSRTFRHAVHTASILHESARVEIGPYLLFYLCLSVLDDETIVSQCVLFIIAGYGTTASALSYAAFLLAKHPDAQQRLRREINALIEEHGDITYQGVMEAKFLDACIMGKSLMSMILYYFKTVKWY